MTEDQIQAALRRYETMIQNRGAVHMERFPPAGKYPSREEALAHARWMCREALTFKGKPEKAQRWLCFVQGILWMTGLENIAGLKDDNRSTVQERLARRAAGGGMDPETLGDIEHIVLSSIPAVGRYHVDIVAAVMLWGISNSDARSALLSLKASGHIVTDEHNLVRHAYTTQAQ